MTDAFGRELAVGDRVLYSVKNGGGTGYAVGSVLELRAKQLEHRWAGGLDRVVVNVERVSEGGRIPSKAVLLYANNVVKMGLSD